MKPPSNNALTELKKKIGANLNFFLGKKRTNSSEFDDHVTLVPIEQRESNKVNRI